MLSVHKYINSVHIRIVQYKFCSPAQSKDPPSPPYSQLPRKKKKNKKTNQFEEGRKQIIKMIPTRTLLQAAAAEHHTPLIRFLGKRSPTSMFNFTPPIPPPPPPLHLLSHTHIYPPPRPPVHTCWCLKKFFLKK